MSYGARLVQRGAGQPWGDTGVWGHLPVSWPPAHTLLVELCPGNVLSPSFAVPVSTWWWSQGPSMPTNPTSVCPRGEFPRGLKSTHRKIPPPVLAGVRVPPTTGGRRRLRECPRDHDGKASGKPVALALRPSTRSARALPMEEGPWQHLVGGGDVTETAVFDALQRQALPRGDPRRGPSPRRLSFAQNNWPRSNFCTDQWALRRSPPSPSVTVAWNSSGLPRLGWTAPVGPWRLVTRSL